MTMKNLFILAILFLAVITVLFLIEKFSFPVAFKVCGLGYQDCHVVAKFKDRDGCEYTNQYWGWLCNQTNKNKIMCIEKESNISTGFCD